MYSTIQSLLINIIGVSTYTFRDRKEKVTDWQQYIREYILPNHSQWGDHDYSKLPPTAIQRYLIATNWSNAKGPTILGRTESSVQSIGQFLAFFPGIQSHIYIIVELVREDLISDSLTLASEAKVGKEKEKGIGEIKVKKERLDPDGEYKPIKDEYRHV